MPTHTDPAGTMTDLLHLLQFGDSAFPVGNFSFSDGIETAAAEGLVRDAATLEAYARDIVRRAASTDGVAALHTRRNQLAGDYAAILETDRQVILCKMAAEARLMTCRTGRKLAELSERIRTDGLGTRWLADIAAGRTPGTYPVAQGMLFAAWGLSEQALFSAHLYGAASTVLNAALRCVRVSHFDTQRILCRLAADAAELYGEARDMELAEMHAFAPQADILASLHEKGTARLFMN